MQWHAADNTGAIKNFVNFTVFPFARRLLTFDAYAPMIAVAAESYLAYIWHEKVHQSQNKNKNKNRSKKVIIQL